MALMLGRLYQALKGGGATEEDARAAAEEVAAYEGAIAGVRTEVRVVQAITGVLVVLTLAVLWQLFAIRGELSHLEGSLDQRLSATEALVRGIDDRTKRIESKQASLAPGSSEQQSPANVASRETSSGSGAAGPDHVGGNAMPRLASMTDRFAWIAAVLKASGKQDSGATTGAATGTVADTMTGSWLRALPASLTAVLDEPAIQIFVLPLVH